jgi:hypothetical protein
VIDGQGCESLEHAQVLVCSEKSHKVWISQNAAAVARYSRTALLRVWQSIYTLPANQSVSRSGLLPGCTEYRLLEQKSSGFVFGRQRGLVDKWEGAARHQSAVCVSCHTSAPYLIARPDCRGALAQKGPCLDEQKLVENV